MYPTYRKGLLKPSYRDVQDGDDQFRQNPYGLRLARRNPDRMYGELTLDQQRAALGAAGVGVVLVIATAWTFAVGPWAVKQFKPEWGYGKRLVTSFLAGTLINFARMAVSPSEEA